MLHSEPILDLGLLLKFHVRNFKKYSNASINIRSYICIHIIRQLLCKKKYLFLDCMYAALITKAFEILELSYV